MPGATYQIVTLLADGSKSLAATAQTHRLADIVTPWGQITVEDVLAAVSGFEQRATAPGPTQVDLCPPEPDGVIDIRDIVMALKAQLGQPPDLGLSCTRWMNRPSNY